MFVSASYVIAALAIYVGALYLIYRVELYFTASSMLLGFLLLVYGPAYLAYMLFRRPISVVDLRISNSFNFDDTVVSLNLSIAIMFFCVIAGIELVDWLAPRSAQALRKAILGWNLEPLSGGRAKPWPLLIVILVLGLCMAWISLKHCAKSSLPRFRKSSASASSICLSVPLSTQYWNRRWQVWYDGKRSGKSCQRAPERNIHRMPLRTSRSSFLGLPRPSALRSGLSSNGSMTCHCSSFNSCW